MDISAGMVCRLLAILPALLAVHIARRDNQGQTAQLTDENHCHIPARVAPAVCSIDVFALNLPILQTPALRVPGKNFLDFAASKMVFGLEFFNYWLQPDYATKAHKR